jgi:transcriptional regulator with XRE-family HTH domain
MQGIGARIKQILRENKQTQKELSQATGIPESTLSDIIKEKKEPGMDKVRLIAEFLKVDLNWLVKGEAFRESARTGGKISEAVGRAEYGAKPPKAARAGKEAGKRREDYRLKFMNEIISILKTLDEEERRLILEMAERLRRKKE